ncbi:MAG: amino acid adenylation domain-containing protein, partial [Acidobacteriota bacterium]|nr:amino acid adenylation domain-containing protein [Acidobacteriota bacterium]
GGEPEPLPIQYGDFAHWQTARMDELSEQLAWWKDHLQGAPALLQLPTDKPRPAVRSERGAVYRFEMSPQLTGALNALATQSGATLFMVLHAGFAALLSRYSLSEDLVIGTPVANRNRPELENLIGFFANMLILRLDLGGEPGFAELLNRARAVALESYGRRDVPFEQIVDAVQPERNSSHTPLFQVVLVMQNMSDGELALPGLHLSPLDQIYESAKFDLTLNVGEYRGKLAAAFEYRTDLFTEPTVARMAEQLTCLLDAVVQTPGVPVGQLPLLSEASRNRMLTTLAAERRAFEPNSLTTRFRRQCDATPHQIALRYKGSDLTYRDLDTRADRMAALLQTQGAGPEVLVGVIMDRTPDLIVTLSAILRTGAAYLPLDPTYPASRIALILEDAGAPLLLTHRGLADDLPRHNATVIDLDRLTLPEQSPAEVVIHPQSTAYVIYTSGSTGKPKGVPVTHGNVCRLFAAADLHFDFGADDVWTLFHSYAFDFSVWEIWGALLYGGRLVLVPHWTARDTQAFYHLLVEEGVTVLNQTPGAFMHLVRVALADEAATPGSLKWVIFGGEALDPAALKPWFDRYGDDRPRLVNMYGITETTVHVTFRALDASDALQGGSAIGAPLADLGLHVLDNRLEPLPAGVPGELCVAGAGLARGYLNRPGLTARRFVPDPYALEPGSRLYRSGDLARRLADGDLDYRGRIDHQVKLRGFRIELGEIRAALLAVPGVSQAEVVIHDEGEKQLAAYVVGKAKEASMRDQLREKLPDYMVPSVFMTLEVFPLTAHGKLDRKRLPAPAPPKTAYAEPRNATEAMLTDIFAEVLELDRVGIHDNFFQLGGHSLLATRVIAGVRERLEAELPLRTLFEKPTVAVLAETLVIAARAEYPPVTSVTRTQDLPLSFNQQRLWFLDQFEGTAASYNIPAALRLQGHLSVSALETALGAVTQRHEILRTTYRSEDGKGLQVVNDAAFINLPLVDLSGLDTETREQAVIDLAAQSARIHFDLYRGPVVRAVVLRLAETAHSLLHVTHHIASDGWSVGRLVGELEAHYRTAVTTGRPAHLPPLPVQYADFAVWQRERMEAGDWQQQRDYWQRQLADAPALHGLATDRPRPALQTFNGAHETFSLNTELTTALNQLAQDHGATLFMVLLAGFKALLHRTTGRDDHVVGTPIAGRNHKETENLIGFFVNTLALRTDTGGDPAFTELLARVRNTSLDAFANQELPFERVVDAVQPERDLSHTPLFQLMFSLQNMPGSDIELPGLTLRQEGSAGDLANFDITLTFVEGGDVLTGSVEYNTDLFDLGTIRRMMKHLQHLYKGIVQVSEARLSQLPLMSEAERSQLKAWSQGPALPDLLPVPHRFRQQALQTPHAPAVAFGGKSFTYRQLLDKADAIAGQLAALGCGAETVVGLCMDRSADLITAIMGCLISGTAYLPLDPKTPSDRLLWMLQDADVRALLTHDHYAPLFNDIASPVIRLDVDVLSTGTPRPFHLDVPAYVIYTSGSTGTPKGVVISHQAMTGFVEAAAGYCDLTADDRVMQFASISFDTAVEEIFPCLLRGGTLYLRDENIEPVDLMETCRKHGITVLTQPTAFWHQVVQAIDAGEATLPECLRLVNTGSERMLVEKLARWQSRVGGRCRLLNTYGPTEACVVATGWEAGDKQPAGEVPIGKAVKGASAHVVDALL